MINSWADNESYELTFVSFANFLAVGVNDWSASEFSRLGCVENDNAILLLGLRKGLQ